MIARSRAFFRQPPVRETGQSPPSDKIAAPCRDGNKSPKTPSVHSAPIGGIRQLFTARESLVAFGLAAAAVILLLRWARARQRRGREPWAGLLGIALVAASVVALALTGDLAIRAMAAVVLVGVGGAISEASGARNPAVITLFAVPGAGLLVTGAGVTTGWMRLAAFLTAVIGGALVAVFDRCQPVTAPLLVAISAFGLYATVPDTERALALVGASVPVALASQAGMTAGLGAAGTPAATALFAWIAATGGAPRPGAVVGGLASLGLLVVAPVAWVESDRRWRLATVIGHTALVVVTARVAGLRRGAIDAGLVVVAAYAATAALVATVMIVRRVRR